MVPLAAALVADDLGPRLDYPIWMLAALSVEEAFIL
jgi:hypothetical protein